MLKTKLAPALSATHVDGNSLAPALGLSQELRESIVYLNSMIGGWYGRGDHAYMPYPEFIERHGVEALTEQVTVTITAHWDSGHPDTYQQASKYIIVGKEGWASVKLNKSRSGGTKGTTNTGEALKQEAWIICETEMRKLYPAFAASREITLGLDHSYNKLAELETGKQVRVFKGRKVPVGTTGECFWLRPGEFGMRAGVRDAAGDVHWTAAANLEVIVDPEDLAY